MMMMDGNGNNNNDDGMVSNVHGERWLWWVMFMVSDDDDINFDTIDHIS
jgi:hypothetical protein